MKPLAFKKHIIPGVCAVSRCTRKTHGRALCSTHRSQKCRLQDPVKYAWQNLKTNAKRRNIPFTITLEQFRQWCHRVTYIGFSGRSADSWTVDRIHNDIGYHIDNIQVLQNKNNIKKYFTYDWRSRTVIEIKQIKEQRYEQDYF